MDFVRTLKKRKPKKRATPEGDRPKSRGIRIGRRGTTLNLAVCFVLFLGLTVITQAQAEDYYFYEGPKGELVISNKQPPPGSKIIKQLPKPTDREVQQAQEPGKPQPNVQTEGSPKPSKNK
jgi:hypothetical protein